MKKMNVLSGIVFSWYVVSFLAGVINKDYISFNNEVDLNLIWLRGTAKHPYPQTSKAHVVRERMPIKTETDLFFKSRFEFYLQSFNEL